MAELLLDAGSSTLKALWVEHVVAGEPEVFGYADPEALGAGLRDCSRPDRIIGVCVAAHEHRRVIEQQCLARWGMDVEWLQTAPAACGVSNGYLDPGELGVDRWAAMLGARAQTDNGLCVADCGTAMTLDAVTGDGRHIGGWIVPGLELAAGVMRARWPGLYTDTVHRTPVVDWPASTAEALASGYPQAQAGTLERFHRLAREHAGETMDVILTGAAAATLAGLLAVPARVDPLLVFRGIRMLSQEQ